MKSGSEMYYEKHCIIETQHGQFDPLNPTFNGIADIAGGLSRKCRFNGQCSRFYSVAEHSVIVSQLMEHVYGGDPMEGLLHDGSEAYLPDVPSPYKHILPDLNALDQRVESALRKYFRLPPSKSKECAQADMAALFIEAYYLLPSQGTGPLWEPIAQFRGEALKYRERFPPAFLIPARASVEFINRYDSFNY
jgi:hypothetical protein